jgi:hypothetical protein
MVLFAGIGEEVEGSLYAGGCLGSVSTYSGGISTTMCGRYVVEYLRTYLLNSVASMVVILNITDLSCFTFIFCWVR